MSHECPHCGKLYQRIAHLRRHELTHQTSGQFNCPFCKKNFSRRDVCRKHATLCKSHAVTCQGVPTEIRTVKRGQRSRACDACAQSKLSCDLGRPCTRCATRQISCHYVKASEDPSNSQVLDPLRTSPLNNEHEDLSIPFLLTLTDPEADSMLSSLVHYCSITEETEPISHGSHGDIFDFNMPIESAVQGMFPWSFSPMLADDFQTDMQLFNTGEESSIGIADSTYLDERMSLLISELKSTHEQLSADPFYDATFDEDIARTVFTAHNAKNFVTTFYRQTYPSFPYTHAPSFDFDTTSCELVLALMMNGSAVLTPQDDAVSATKLYRISELYIFRRLEQILPSAQKNCLPSRALLDVLSACLAIYGINSASNHIRGRNLVNAQRLPFLVSTVRYLGLTGLRHQKSLHETSWADFVHTELGIRVASWTAFLSWQEAGMQNCAPLMTVVEMTADLPCLQSLWDAQDETGFQATLHASNFDLPSSSSISDCFESLMREKWTGVPQFPRTLPTLQDLLLIVFSIHAAAVSARLMGMLPTMAPGILRAIRRWFEVWDATVARLGPELVRNSGLPRYSASLAWLAQGTVEISLAPGPQCGYLQNIGQASVEELHSMVQALKGR